MELMITSGMDKKAFMAYLSTNNFDDPNYLHVLSRVPLRIPFNEQGDIFPALIPYINAFNKGVNPAVLAKKIGMNFPKLIGKKKFEEKIKDYFKENLVMYNWVITRNPNLIPPIIDENTTEGELMYCTDSELFNLYQVFIYYKNRLWLLSSLTSLFRRYMTSAFIPIGNRIKIQTNEPVIAIGSLYYNIQYTLKYFNDNFNQIIKNKTFQELISLIEPDESQTFRDQIRTVLVIHAFKFSKFIELYAKINRYLNSRDL